MRWLVAFFAGAVALSAQAESGALSPEVLLLAKVRERMVWNLQRQPNYTCVETVERSQRAAATRKYQLLDTLRLEVALVDGKEMFGWPGAKNFQDTDIRNIVAEGAFGNGNFANHARALFVGQSAMFDHSTETVMGDRPAVRFDYRVPLLTSGYRVRVQDREALVAYHGSIYADPKTFDLKRLEVKAEDIPLALGLARVSDQMDYARIPIGESEFLLPEASELTMVNLNGTESRNRVRFASCRQFSGESVLTFGDAPRNEEPPQAIAQIGLPPDLSLTLSLLDDVDLNSAVVGDAVRARLEYDLKQKGRILFPKGATATGRITRLERHEDYTVVGLEFSELEANGVHAPLSLKLESVAGQGFLNPQGSKTLLPVARPGEGIIPLSTGRMRLSRGILMFWRTNS